MSERSQYGFPEPPTDEKVIAEQQRGARRTALILLLLVLVIGVAAFYYISKWRTALDAGRDETINVLLLGVTDRATDDTLDAVVVASFQPRTKAVKAVALPASTVLPWATADDGSLGAAALASLPSEIKADSGTGAAPEDDVAAGTGAALEDEVAAVSGAAPADDVAAVSRAGARAPQLRDVYAEGDRAALTGALERLLGAPIHHTVRVDYSGFVELVDLLGGVSVEVLSEVTYRDAEGEVAFHLEPGVHRLDGEEALLYVRYKGAESEARRLERQRLFVEQVVSETRRQFGWEKIQPLIRIALNHVATDLDLAGATRLVSTVFDSERVDYALHMLPGTDGEQGWVMDAARTASLSGQVFHNPSWSEAAP